MLGAGLASCAPPPLVPPAPTKARAPAAETRRPVSVTSSPQPDRAPLLVVPSCGEADLGLRRAAEAALAEYVAESRMPTPEALEFQLRNAGVPYVWVHAWAATGRDLPTLQPELEAWTNTQPAAEGMRRCGVAAATAAGATHAFALSADVLADVSPVPRTARTGQWLTLDAQMHVEVSETKVVALGPHGAPHQVPVHITPRGPVHAQLPLASPGRWLFQLLPTTKAGPRPVAEVEIFVDITPPVALELDGAPSSPAPSPASNTPAELTLLLNQARASEKLAPLTRERVLDELAQAHADAMQRSNRLAHDLGQGDAYIRVSPELPDAALIGENIAHATNAQAAHRALWWSPAHRQNLLRQEYTHVGIGVARGPDGDVWVCQLFAAQMHPSATY